MDKKEYLFKALKTELVFDAQWLISLLSYTKYDIEPDNIPEYTLKYEDNKCFYYSSQDRVWIQIDGEYDKRGLFIYNEPLDLIPGILENAPDGIKDTTIGRVIMNKLIFCYPFGNKFPYINDKFMPGQVEKMIISRLKDDYTPDIKKDISIEEYLKYTDSALFVQQLTQVCTPGVTEKAISPPPTAKEHLARLVEANKDHLDDPLVIANIGKEMEQLDKDYLKGDRSLGFLIKPKKDFSVVRKKMYLVYGFDQSFNENDPIDFIDQPLVDGIDYRKLDSYINGSRLGSYSRGAETQLGGVAVKELLRSSSNASIGIEDCNTLFGIKTLLTESNIKSYLGFYFIDNGKSVQITSSNKDSLIGKTVTMRSPAYCRAEGSSYCSKCVGPYLSLHENGISSAVSAMGSVFMNISMKAMHGKALNTIKLDFDELIS